MAIVDLAEDRIFLEDLVPSSEDEIGVQETSEEKMPLFAHRLPQASVIVEQRIHRDEFSEPIRGEVERMPVGSELHGVE